MIIKYKISKHKIINIEREEAILGEIKEKVGEIIIEIIMINRLLMGLSHQGRNPTQKTIRIGMLILMIEVVEWEIIEEEEEVGVEVKEITKIGGITMSFIHRI